MRRLALVLMLAAAPLAARADDIRNAIAQAQRAYAAGDLAATREALAEAAQLLAQRAAEGLAAALPPPQPGWSAREPERRAAGAALFGGFTQASRRYAHPAGREVRVEITADTPMLALVALVLANPAMAGPMGRIQRLGDQRGIVQQNGDVTLLLNNRFLVQISGSGTAEEKLAYARAIDPAKLPN